MKEEQKKIIDLIPVETQSKIKEYLQKFNLIPATPAPAPAPVQLAEAKLADGTVVKSDTSNIEVGSTLTLVTPTGEMPAPEGEHVMQDGSVVKVGPDSKVIEIVPPPASTPSPDVPMTQVAQMKSEFEAKVSQFNSEKDALKSKVSAQDAEIKKLQESVTSIAQMFSALLETPTGEAKEKPKNKVPKDNPIDRFINRDKK